MKRKGSVEPKLMLELQLAPLETPLVVSLEEEGAQE
jgi:hypothetical protein